MSPYEDVRPYDTLLVAGSSVVHVMEAVVEDAELWMFVMTGGTSSGTGVTVSEPKVTFAWWATSKNEPCWGLESDS
jgi:hypothetical protein